MAISSRTLAPSKYKAHSALKKNGIVLSRFIFNGTDVASGEEKHFFIELEFLNAGLQEEPVLGFANNASLSSDDLQYALAGTLSAKELQYETLETPSYVAVRAGYFGKGAKQICAYTSLKNCSAGFKISQTEVGPCIFNDEKISGSIEVSERDLRMHPEFLCDAGTASWELEYKIESAFQHVYEEKLCSWIPFACKASFTGNIIFDNHHYRVNAKSSCGYADVNFCETLPEPFFHLSASNLTSHITGKTMFNSCFAVHGLQKNALAIIVKFEDLTVALPLDVKSKSQKTLWTCQTMPNENDDEKLHWSVSGETSKWIIDIDITCAASLLFVRDFELPQGKRKVLKLLSGGHGNGEIKLYKRIGKNLELVEDAHVAGALCEFGKLDDERS